jgi:hypothetical protein
LDIRISEREKRLLFLGTRVLRKKLGKNAAKENIDGYLRTCTDKGFNEILDMIDFIYDNTKQQYQARIFKEYSQLCLFIAVNHPKLKPYLESLITTFTKYDNINIDVKPCTSKFDIYMIDKAINYLIKKFSERPTYYAILDEAYITSNDIGKYFMNNIKNVKNSFEDERLEKSIHSFLWLGVWMGLNDTAYRHQFYYVINKLGNSELTALASALFFEPDKWYINIYKEATDRTHELWNKNEIPRHQNSLIEEPCVVHKQQEVFKKHLEKYGVK